MWQRGAGWLAIRPPDSSFSLIPVASLRRAAGSNVAEIAGSDVVAWIGSNLDHTGDHKWQVQLEAAEKVVVLGTIQQRLHQAAAEEKVARIAPPAGEFRWIRHRDLQAPLPTQETAAESPVRLAEYQVPAAAEVDEASKPPAADGFVARRGGTPASADGRSFRTAARTPRRTGEPAFHTALRDAELRLSLMAAQPASSWDFESLRHEVQALVDRGQSTLERARSQRLLEQIEDFDSLKQRSVLLHGDQATGGAETPDAVGSGEGGSGEAEPLVDPRFDGTRGCSRSTPANGSHPPMPCWTMKGGSCNSFRPLPA